LGSLKEKLAAEMIGCNGVFRVWSAGPDSGPAYHGVFGWWVCGCFPDRQDELANLQANLEIRNFY